MRADRSAAVLPPTEGTEAADADRERFVFGADPARDRWWGRPLAETWWCPELGRLLADPVWHGIGVPRGDGRPVVLMPSFFAGDQILRVMAAWLRRVGYRPRFAGFVTNTDCSDRGLDRVERTVDELWGAARRRVAVVGHSRGGDFVRAVAARRPERVSHPISMGFDRVRLSSIYSKGDRVVHWQCQVIPHADCVEVTGCHLGLIFNRKVYRGVANALALPELPTTTIRCQS
jgi:pimeloyl-ACP methyl ester carboxylesterase